MVSITSSVPSSPSPPTTDRLMSCTAPFSNAFSVALAMSVSRSSVNRALLTISKPAAKAAASAQCCAWLRAMHK